jgi:hypothetical protein
MTDIPIVVGGLQPTEKDSRDFKLGNVVSLPQLEEIPESFDLGVVQLVDQIDDFCTGAATCAASALQEGVPLSWKYSMAASKEITGDKDEWGQQIRPAMLTHVKVGAIPLDESPHEQNTDSKFLRDIKNWPDYLKSIALKHKKKSVFFVSGQYDHYDNIRALIWKFREKKKAVVSGVIWNWPLDTELIDQVKNEGTGHCIVYRGWTSKGLIMQNSYGTKAGHGGFHIVSREVVNKNFAIFDGAMFIDIDPEDAKVMSENNIPLWISSLVKLIRQIINYLYANR